MFKPHFTILETLHVETGFLLFLLIIILVVALKKKDDSGNNPDPTPPSPIPEGFNIYSVDQSNLTNSPYMMTGVLLANASP